MKYIKKYKYIITSIILLITFLYTIFTKKELNQNKNIISEETNNIENIIESNQEINTCIIDIKGEINNPGVYEISCNSKVNDAISLAGGLTLEADTSIINLAKKITDEMVIIIYSKEEVKNSNIVDTVIKVVEKECVCPNIQNDGCLNTEITSNIGENNLININTSSLEELTKIPGIGESKAKSIIKYREEIGLFTTIEDVLNVDGIGKNLYEQIKIYITT